MDMLAFIFNTLASAVLANWIMTAIYRRTLTAHDPDQLREDQIRAALKRGDLIALNVEKIDQQVLCYNAVTGDFVCQGQDMREIEQRFQHRYPGRQAVLASGEPDLVDQLYQQQTQK
jgi:hypothetical protein